MKDITNKIYCTINNIVVEQQQQQQQRQQQDKLSFTIPDGSNCKLEQSQQEEVILTTNTTTNDSIGCLIKMQRLAYGLTMY
jgi:hypothetical protein